MLGVPPQDRGLLYDWSNRVIGWQDPDYAVSATFVPVRGTDLARRRSPCDRPGSYGRMPDPRTRADMPDLYTYAAGLGERKRAFPATTSCRSSWRSVMTAGGDGHVTIEEFENLFWLFAVAGNETLRNGIPGGLIALLEHPESQRALRADRTPRGRRAAPLVDAGHDVSAHGHDRHRARRAAGAAGDKVVVSFASANRDEQVFAAPTSSTSTATRGRTWPSGTVRTSAWAHLARVQMRALFTELLARTSWIESAGSPGSTSGTGLPARGQAAADPLDCLSPLPPTSLRRDHWPVRVTGARGQAGPEGALCTGP